MVKLLSPPPSHQDLLEHVRCRTGRRVLGLTVEVQPEGVVLQGRTATYHVKQLAQQAVRELLPAVRLQNAIVVD
jgi:hypothetical protein